MSRVNVSGRLYATVSEERLSTPAADPTPLVLVVDDDPEFRTVLMTVLRADGLRCETASDGASAVERALALRPQLVLSLIHI